MPRQPVKRTASTCNTSTTARYASTNSRAGEDRADPRSGDRHSNALAEVQKIGQTEELTFVAPTELALAGPLGDAIAVSTR
jgi:hypothetical protein